MNKYTYTDKTTGEILLSFYAKNGTQAEDLFFNHFDYFPFTNPNIECVIDLIQEGQNDEP